MTAAADRAFREGRQQRGDAAIREDAYWIGRGFTGWDDVVAKVREYWPEGLDLVQEMLFELRNAAGQARPRSRVRRARWSADDGDEIDVDRLRAGQDYWRQTVREEHDAPQNLCLLFSLAASSDRTSREVLWRGAAAIVLADLLEACGYRVELWGAAYNPRGYLDGADLFQAVCLKASEAPVDIASLVNGIAGWFYRTVFFQSYYADARHRPSRSRYVAALSAEMRVVRDLAGNARVVVLDGVWDRAAAAAKVQEVVAQLS